MRVLLNGRPPGNLLLAAMFASAFCVGTINHPCTFFIDIRWFVDNLSSFLCYLLLLTVSNSNNLKLFAK